MKKLLLLSVLSLMSVNVFAGTYSSGSIQGQNAKYTITCPNDKIDTLDEALDQLSTKGGYDIISMEMEDAGVIKAKMAKNIGTQNIKNKTVFFANKVGCYLSVEEN
jgi:hypothetical protein